mgnify:CR=1 FL=1
MPWQETLLMDQRVQFIADYQRDVARGEAGEDDLVERRMRLCLDDDPGRIDASLDEFLPCNYGLGLFAVAAYMLWKTAAAL